MYSKLPKPFFVLAPMDDVTDTVFRQIVHSCAPADLYFTEFVNVDGLQSAGREKLLPKLRFAASEGPLIAQLWGKIPENFYKTAREIADGSLAREICKLNDPTGSLHMDAEQGDSEARNETYVRYGEVSTGAGNTALRHKPAGMAGSAGQQGMAVHTCPNFAGVDLNMGCPAKSEVQNGTCSALILPMNRELAGQIIDASREGVTLLNGTSLPLSVKTRLGYREVDHSWHEFLLSKKLNMLTIHGRTKAQMSKVPAEWDKIQKVRELRDQLSPTTLIVGNGDVLTRAQGQELAKKLGLDGIMIGRGIFQDPFIFSKDSSWKWEGMTRDEKIALYRKHVELFTKTWSNSERRLITLNKFCKIYINGFDGAKELREQLMNCTTAEQLLALLDN